MANQPSVLVCDDDDAFRTVIGMELRRRGFTVHLAATGQQAQDGSAELAPDLMLLDLRLPDADGLAVLRAVQERPNHPEVVILTGHGSVDHAMEAVRAGAADYATKPCPVDEIELRLRKALERRTLLVRTRALEGALSPPDLSRACVGVSDAHRRALQLVDRFAPSDAAVLILGETGTGKEVIAKLIHARSLRTRKPFVVVDCAALHEELLQSELFGHERGAYTGAVAAKAGLFEVADGGTIFLDEIGDTSLSVQVKLLRVLESATFRRLGGTRELKVDVRVVAATNRDLAAMIAKGRFRDDLFYRLGAVRIDLAPLRQRREDIVALAESFAARVAARLGSAKTLDPAAIARLQAHDWPGNARELLHCLEQALLVADGPTVRVEHLPAGLGQPRPAQPQAGPELPEDLCTLEQLERRHIARALAACHGHRAKAARVLGISERNLYRKINEFRL